MRIPRGSIAVAVLALLVTACASPAAAPAPTTGTQAPTGTASPAAKAPLTVGMALAAPKNDGGFAQAHYRGLQIIESQMGGTVQVVENAVAPDARVRALSDLASDNKLVIGVGGEFAQAGLQVARQFPNVTFVVTNGQLSEDLPNLHAQNIREGVPAYVAGAAMAGLSKTKKAAVLVGLQIPVADAVAAAYSAGLKSQDPSITVTSTVVGSFNDPQRAFASASAAIADGADVIYAFLSAGFPGVVQAVKESGKDVKVSSNVSLEKCKSGPFVVGISYLDAGTFVADIAKQYAEGSLPRGVVRVGIENPEIQRFQSCPGFENLDPVIKKTSEGINSKTISLPAGV